MSIRERLNGNAKLLTWATVVGTVLLALGAVGGWLASVRADGAFHARVEAHLAESVPLVADLHDTHDMSRENRDNIKAINKDVADLVESQKRLTDKVDLLIQTMMRRGEIAR